MLRFNTIRRMDKSTFKECRVSEFAHAEVGNDCRKFVHAWHYTMTTTR
jgi:hypothetical protein